MALLEAKGVSKRFGGLMAINHMDYVLEEGQISSIIGPNGAGKTTFFNTLTGIYQPEEGSIHFNGHSLIGRRPDQIISLGVARTFQNIRLFGSMTVSENILVGMHYRLKQSPIGTLFHSKGFKGEEEESYRIAQQMNDHLRANQPADFVADTNASILHDDIDSTGGRSVLDQHAPEHRKQYPELFVDRVGIEAVRDDALRPRFAFRVQHRNRPGFIVAQPFDPSQLGAIEKATGEPLTPRYFVEQFIK